MAHLNRTVSRVSEANLAWGGAPSGFAAWAGESRDTP